MRSWRREGELMTGRAAATMDVPGWSEARAAGG